MTFGQLRNKGGYEGVHDPSNKMCKIGARACQYPLRGSVSRGHTGKTTPFGRRAGKGRWVERWKKTRVRTSNGKRKENSRWGKIPQKSSGIEILKCTRNKGTSLTGGAGPTTPLEPRSTWAVRDAWQSASFRYRRYMGAQLYDCGGRTKFACVNSVKVGKTKKSKARRGGGLSETRPFRH